jgi:hypothetical protein
MIDPSAAVAASGTHRISTAKWLRRATAACTGAAFATLVLSPLAHADDGLPDPSGAAATASSVTQAAENYMYDSYSPNDIFFDNPDVIAPGLPDAGAETAYGALLNAGQDGITTFTSLYSQEFQFISEAFSDFGVVSSSIEGGIGDVGSLLGGIAGVAKAAGATGPVDVTSALGGIQYEDAQLTTQLADLPTSTDQIGVVGDLGQFQTAIDNAVDNLSGITAYDNDPTLITDLEEVFIGQIGLSTDITNLGQEIAIGSPAGIVSDNAQILDYAINIYDDLQNAISEFAYQFDLTSIGL